MVIQVPWQAWYGDINVNWEFPEGWQVQVCRMADAPTVDASKIVEALGSPIGRPPLKELASGRKKAVLVVEDITRPAPTSRVLPIILAELQEAGIPQESTRILVGLGAHAPMTRPLLIKKLGREVVETYEVFQHQPYINVTYIGQTSYGTPVYINDLFLEADLRVAVGSITPHGMMGFGGGAKTISVGIAGIETIGTNHHRAWDVMTVGIVPVEKNEWRDDLEEIAQIAKLDFIVHSVVNSQREIAGVFAGDPKKAHRAGIKFARDVYRTILPEPVDVVVVNAYPKDTDLIQSINALNVIDQDVSRVLHEKGTLVIASACSQGAGIHSLVGVGIGPSEPYERVKKFLEREVILYSPNLSPPEVKMQYPPDTGLYNDWQGTIKELRRRHGGKLSLAIFPCGSVQIPPDA